MGAAITTRLTMVFMTGGAFTDRARDFLDAPLGLQFWGAGVGTDAPPGVPH